MTAADEISGQSRVTVMTCSRNLSPSLSITTLTVAFTLAHAAKEGSGITREEERQRHKEAHAIGSAVKGVTSGSGSVGLRICGDCRSKERIP